MRSVAPEFESGQHEVYVRRLEEVVLHKRNRNIALTGRYGVGQPYEVVGGSRAEFDLSGNSSNETLFKRLESAGRIRFVPKLGGRGRKVRALV